MADNSLLARLDGIESRFEEVATLITDPSVIQDMKRYVRLFICAELRQMTLWMLT